MSDLTSIAPYAGVFGLAVALAIYMAIVQRGDGNELMREIAERIHSGAMVFLKREYSILAVFVLVVAVLLAWRLHAWTAVCFIGGAICSALAGFLGMKAATKANVRTAEAARSGGEGPA